MAYFDMAHERWVGQHTTGTPGMDDFKRETEWFDSKSDAEQFAKTGYTTHLRAVAMYDAHKTATEFAQIFTRAELEELAKRCMLTPENDYTGEAYDDEVFDALALID